MQLPLTVWSWFVAACMMVPAFTVLLAACGMLFSDRHFGTSFFFPPVDVMNGVVLHHAAGSPLLWQNLFWFFGHPEVYIAVLPAMGLTTTLLATFAGHPLAPRTYRTMVAATIAIGLLGFSVWGHHMFVSGMNPVRRPRIRTSHDCHRDSIRNRGDSMAGVNISPVDFAVPLHCFSSSASFPCSSRED